MALAGISALGAGTTSVQVEAVGAEVATGGKVTDGSVTVGNTTEGTIAVEITQSSAVPGIGSALSVSGWQTSDVGTAGPTMIPITSSHM